MEKNYFFPIVTLISLAYGKGLKIISTPNSKEVA